MKKKGFSLIELLAVIVVLAIILVIAVPKVSDVIYLSRQKTFKTNAFTLVSMAEKLYQNSYAGSLKETGIVYEIEGGKILSNGEEVDLADGKIDGTGFIQITDDGESKIAIENDEFCAVKEFSQAEVIVTDKVDGVPCGKVYVSFSYDLNGGTTTQSFESSYLERTKLTLVYPTKKDSEFVAWKVTKGNSTIEDDVLTIGSKDTIIYALWKNNPILTIDLNGGSTSQSFESSYSSGTTITLQDPTKEGYTFVGWEITGGNGVLSGDRFTIGSVNTTIRANWTANTYTITYNLNGGTLANNAPMSAVYDNTTTLISPTKTGYTFAGWTASSGVVSGNTFTPAASNATLTANWTANTYTITYNLNGGTKGTNAPTSGTYESTLTISNPSKTGYTFNGWTVTSGLNTSTAKYGTSASSVTTAISSSSTKITAQYFKNLTATNGGSVTLTANWTANTYTITYNLNGGTLASNAPTSVVYGNSVTLVNPTKTGYTFAGWTASNGTISGNTFTPTASNATLTANWTANTYTITYNLNGGTKGTNAPTSGTYGSTVTISNPTRAKYTFTGWTVSGTGAILSGTNLTIGAGNVTLTANWRENYTIPVFTYTGSYEILDDNDAVITNPSTWTGNWKIRFLSSGTFNMTTLNGAADGIDVFLVGGGGNGGGTLAYRAGCYGYSAGGGGGGGGYRTTQKGISVSTGTNYTITVGATKGTSSGFGYSAAGGSDGAAATGLESFDNVGKGGAGGSKGGAGGLNSASGANGEDGGYEFGGTSGRRYGAGGGGGHSHNGGTNDVSQFGSGGAGGGGNGNGQYYGYTSGHNGTANTGGGGGGASYHLNQTNYYPYYSSQGYTWVDGTTYSAGTGGSGIVIIRNKR